MLPYAPRPIHFDGLRTRGDWRVKTYVVTYGAAPFDRARFAEGEALALAALPAETTPARPGLAFLVLHQGNGADYAVLGWWDRENELPLRVLVRPGDEPAWRPARGAESLCVWDLQVVWHEREAYVATVLARGDAADADAYLSRTLTLPAAEPLALRVLPDRLAVARLGPGAELPTWAAAASFVSVTRTLDELSVVCADEGVPPEVRAERGWRALAVDGPLDFALVGVVARLAAPLAAAGIGVLTIATHDTDYVLVRDHALAAAVRALRDAGFVVADAGRGEAVATPGAADAGPAAHTAARA